MLIRHVATSLAVLAALAACNDDDDGGNGPSAGGADVEVSGAIESNWDGRSFYAVDDEEGDFFILAFDGDYPSEANLGLGTYDGEFVAFYFENSGQPGTGSYGVGDGQPAQALYYNDAGQRACLTTNGRGGQLVISESGSQMVGTFEFDAFCSDLSTVSVTGSFDAEAYVEP